MNPLLDACRQALRQENWYAALVVALTLPDVCSNIEYPHLRWKPGTRYREWWHEHLGSFPSPSSSTWAELTVGITAEQGWLMRCKVLHESTDVLGPERGQQFQLLYPHESLPRIGQLTSGPRVFLYVDQFCETICRAVERWVQDTALPDPRMNAALKDLLVIKPTSSLNTP